MTEPSPLARRVATVRAALRKNLERLQDYVGDPEEGDLLTFFTMPSPVLPGGPDTGPHG